MKGKKWKNFMAKLYGFGASVVIIGALFKIQHWPGAGIMLTLGLSTEAVIFFFSAFEKPHEEPDWSLVYPELAGMSPEDEEEEDQLEAAKEEPTSVTEELDRMLEEAKIGPELIESLGSGLRSLSDNASKLNDMTDASVATNEYVTNIKSASSSVEELGKSYAKASESLTSLNVDAEEGQTYGEQLKQVSKNLSQLNAQYELQLQGSSEFIENQNKLQSGITDLLSNLSDSVDDTRKYKDEVAKLADNLSQLNTVYGNMLSAMGGSRTQAQQ